jgi:uncharacterized protein with HEPN domain
MPRSVAAYLADILDACDAIAAALEGIDLAAYRRTVAAPMSQRGVVVSIL